MNISFKAQLKGNFETYMSDLFEYKTQSFSDYTLVHAGKDEDLGWDLFVLEKNGVPKERYIVRNTQNKKAYKIDELLKVFNILKIKEALTDIAKQKQAKLSRNYNDYLISMNENLPTDEPETKN